MNCISGSSFSLADDTQVRRFGAGLDQAAGRPVGAAELAGSEHVAVDSHELEVRHAGEVAWLPARDQRVETAARKSQPDPRAGEVSDRVLAIGGATVETIVGQAQRDRARDAPGSTSLDVCPRLVVGGNTIDAGQPNA